MKTLIKLKYKIYLNRFKELPTIKKLMYPLMITIIYLGICFVSALLIKNFDLMKPENRWYFYVFYLTLLILIFPYEINNVYKKLFELTDLQLFLTSPLKSKDVFLFKNLEISLSCFLVLFFTFVPSQICYGLFLELPLYYYFNLLVAIFLHCSLLIAIVQLIIILCIRIAGPSNRKEIITFISGCIGFITYAIFYLGWDKIDFKNVIKSLETTSNAGWFLFQKFYLTIELSATREESKAMMNFLIHSSIIVVAISICIQIFDIFYKRGWFYIDEAKNMPKFVLSKKAKSNVIEISSYSKSIMKKDIRIFLRDLKIWDVFIVPLALFTIFCFASYIKGMEKSLIILLVVFSIWMAYRLSLNFIVMEGENIFILKTAPINLQKVINIKAILSIVVTSILSFVAGMIQILFFGVNIVFVISSFAVSLFFIFSISILVAMYGFSFLEFTIETKILSISPEGILRFWGYFICILLLIVMFLLIALVIMFSSKLNTLVSSELYLIRYIVGVILMASAAFLILRLLYKKYLLLSSKELNIKII